MPDRPDNFLSLNEYNRRRLELISQLPITCYGDANIMSLCLKDIEVTNGVLHEIFGEQFVRLKTMFSLMQG